MGLDEHRFQEGWLKNYIDGRVGVLYCGSVVDGAVHKVLWEDTFWYYRLEYLKVLGQVVLVGKTYSPTRVDLKGDSKRILLHGDDTYKLGNI